MGNFDIGDEKSNFDGQETGVSGVNSRFTAYVSSMFDPSLTWADIDWLRRYLRLCDMKIHVNLLTREGIFFQYHFTPDPCQRYLAAG